MLKKMRMSNVIMYSFVALIVALYLIFFTWRSTNPDTWVTQWQWFTTQGIQSFRLGMDVSWWVRLTYKVDFSKYENQYTSKLEFDTVKKNALTIIKKQIDKRVSVLWVSDYQAYTKSIDDKDYMIVELWWVHSLEQAKEIIWKTVELEFKVAYDEAKNWVADMKAQRKKMAESLLTQINENPANFAQLWQAKESDDIYYQSFTNTSLKDMPLFFTQNDAMFTRMQSGQISSLTEGLFETTYWYGENGELEEKNLQGYTLVKFGSRVVESLETIDLAKLQSLSSTLWYKLNTDDQSTDLWIASWTITYNATNKTVSHNNGESFSDQKAFNAEIYVYVKESLLGKSVEEVNAINASSQLIENSVISALNSWNEVIVSWVELLTDGRISEDNLLSAIPTFAWTDTDTIKSFEGTQWQFIVKVNSQKEKTDKLYTISTVSGVEAKDYDAFAKKLKEEVKLTLETIFVKDSPSWVPAVDPTTNQILNGAFFERSRLDTSQWYPTVAIDFDDVWKGIFCRISKEYTQKQVAIFVWGQLQTSPTIQEAICGWTAVINWSYDVKEARDLVDSLNEWALPAPLLLANEEKVSAVLWERALTASLLSWALWVLAIFCMLILMYWPRKWMVGALVLVAFLIYLMAFLKIIDYALSLSGIAAIILSLWMGIDANILIFERVREELASWKKINSAIETWYERSRSPIFDGNFSTMFIALFLMLWGIWVFKGFGSLMVLTTLIILLVNVPLTKELLHLFLNNKNEDKKNK